MSNPTSNLLAAAQAEDTFDLLNHIAWTDVIKPKMTKIRDQYSIALVNHLLGSPLPEGLTKEQLAGKIYGIDYITTVIENILTRGKNALEDLNDRGISLK